MKVMLTGGANLHGETKIGHCEESRFGGKTWQSNEVVARAKPAAISMSSPTPLGTGLSFVPM